MSTGSTKLFLLLDETTTKCCCLSLPTAFIIVHSFNILLLIILQIGISFFYFPKAMMILSFIFFSLWICLSIVLIVEILLSQNYFDGFFKRLQELMCFSHCIGGLFYGLGLVMLYSNKSDPLFDYYIAIYYIFWGILISFESYASFLTYSQFKKCELPDINKKDDFQRIPS